MFNSLPHLVRYRADQFGTTGGSVVLQRSGLAHVFRCLVPLLISRAHGSWQHVCRALLTRPRSAWEVVPAMINNMAWVAVSTSINRVAPKMTVPGLSTLERAMPWERKPYFHRGVISRLADGNNPQTFQRLGSSADSPCCTNAPATVFFVAKALKNPWQLLFERTDTFA